jgi:hypothetical protein
MADQLDDLVARGQAAQRAADYTKLIGTLRSPAEWETWRALINACAACDIAVEKCEAAVDFGSEVHAGLEQARKGLAYALALVEGKV